MGLRRRVSIFSIVSVCRCMIKGVNGGGHGRFTVNLCKRVGVMFHVVVR